MNSNEFSEIREAWMELRTIYNEIDAMNGEEMTAMPVGSYATPPVASAR